MELVELKQEAEHAGIYTELQAMRFQGRITVSYEDLPEKVRNITVPKLILQPVIENAFEHGLRNKVSDGSLTVKFIQIDNGVSITVEDNGDELDNDKLNKLKNDLTNDDPNIELTGLLNINKRIRMTYNNNSGVSVERAESGGLRVVILIITEECEES